jgi:hypothetical protein
MHLDEREKSKGKKQKSKVGCSQGRASATFAFCPLTFDLGLLSCGQSPR